MPTSKNWWRTTLTIRGSVIPAILPRISLCGGFGFLISLAHAFHWQVSYPLFGTVIPGLVLGLLLVFRTNTAYERFWEGRKCWGTIMNTSRNLARQISFSVAERHAKDHAEKIAAMRLLVAFAIATKFHLRQEPLNDEIQDVVSPSQYQKLRAAYNPPLEIILWLGNYLQRQYEDDRLNTYQLSALHRLSDTLVDMLGACERILKTPMPVAYAIHLRQMLLLYCLLLPFQIVEGLRWLTGPIVAVVSFALFGIEAIGLEIENPFGRDPNDLPLDTICNNLRRNVEDLIQLSPGYPYPGDLSLYESEPSAP